MEDRAAFTGAFALSKDGRVDLHHLSVFPAIGATGLEDLAHQRLVGKQRLQQLLLVLPLLGELGQPARRAMVEDGEAHQFGIERIR